MYLPLLSSSRPPAPSVGRSPSGSSQRRITAAVTSTLGALALLGTAGLLVTAAGEAHAQAAPGDVYFSAHVDQRFHYYVFVNDRVYWADTTVAGTSFDYVTARDSATVHGSVHVSTAVQANAGTLTFDIDSEMILQARTGLFHQIYDDLDLFVYVRGSSGTPFVLTVATSGTLLASRLGGLPGSLAPLNGVASANFESSDASVPDGGIAELALDSLEVISGATTTEIAVNGTTYSLAFHRVFTSRGSLSQNVCILGCMTEAADFHSLVDGHVEVNVFPGATLAAPTTASAIRSLTLAPLRNPIAGAGSFAFAAPAGASARLDIFDVRGRRVARLFDGVANGGPQSVTWNAAAQPAGLYFARLECAGRIEQRKVTLIR